MDNKTALGIALYASRPAHEIISDAKQYQAYLSEDVQVAKPAATESMSVTLPPAATTSVAVTLSGASAGSAPADPDQAPAATQSAPKERKKRGPNKVKAARGKPGRKPKMVADTAGATDGPPVPVANGVGEHQPATRADETPQLAA